MEAVLVEHLGNFGRQIPRDGSPPVGPNKAVTLTFYLRSVDGMVYYIGGVVRRQLQQEENDGSPIFIKRELPYERHRSTKCWVPDKECSYLFVLTEGWGTPGTAEFVSIDYEGHRFSIPDSRDLQRGGNSSVVLDILRQQIALNSSAKSLPQSSVVSLVGGQ
jgi:hypothetical protein